MGFFRSLVLPTRLFQTMPAFRASASVKGNASHVKKESLRELRQRTGYSFSSCKEALIKFNDDLQQAEVWLEEQAKERGWNKTTQLQTRVASQGLVGFLQTRSTGVLVEVNCETDFVARTARFQQLVQCITRAVFEQARQAGPQQETFDKLYMGSEELVKLPCSSSSCVEEQLALCTGKLGERIAVRRACLLSVPSCCYLGSYVHGTPPPLLLPPLTVRYSVSMLQW
uniref:elongation factor Ts, mitochondrial n=1 Tax=Myxine glutinosa TaxID=7769 RepID=UPI00358F7D4B